MRNLSQRRLGVLAGIHEGSASARLNQYETGKHHPDILITKKIGDALNVPMAYFYCEDDQLAELLRCYYQLSQQQRKSLWHFFDELKQHLPND